MRNAWPYDAGVDPPAPVLPLHVADPADAAGMLLPALVDTGADCTLIPAVVARRLRLPMVGRLAISGVGGHIRRAPVHAAIVEVAGLRALARVVALEEEIVVGRDLLNRLVALLDGPGLTISLRSARTRRGSAAAP